MESLNAPASPFDVNALRIASPCKMEWWQMKGDERIRFCGACKLNVYNIGELTNAEVEELVTSSEGRVCMRLFRRADGTVITRDCPIGQRLRDRARMAMATVAAGVVGILGLTSIFGSNIRAMFAVSAGGPAGDAVVETRARGRKHETKAPQARTKAFRDHGAPGARLPVRD